MLQVSAEILWQSHSFSITSAFKSFLQDFEDILTYIEDALEQDVEQLSENGNDRMFQHLSAVFRNLYLLLARAQTAFQADKLVSSICQRHAAQHSLTRVLCCLRLACLLEPHNQLAACQHAV